MDRKAGRVVVVALAGLGLAIGTGIGVASAHIDPDPAAVEGGTAATVAFNLEHGCDSSPTTGLDIQVPSGITDAQPVAKDGWTATVDADVIRFSGGSIDASAPDSFSLTFTAPTTPGVINFPVVQTCAEGEIAWLDIAAEGEAEPEHPAPALLITDGPPTADDLASHDDEEAAADDGATTATELSTTVAAPSSDDDSNTGLIVGVVIAAVVVLGAGGYVAARSRSKRATK